MPDARTGGVPGAPATRFAPTTRFAPAPTGHLHLGHVLDAIHVWGIARAAGGRVVLRIEDHDRQRSRRAFETSILDDLEWLGLVPDVPPLEELRSGRSPFRQTDDDDPYAAATAVLAGAGVVYACDCSRSAFAAWAAGHGPWTGPGCPRGCRDRGLEDLPGRTLRAAIGDGEERWDDRSLGRLAGPVSPDGDPPIRDPHGNRTYNLAVVVDDDRHGIDLVIRGRDLVEATPRQIRLGRLLGRETPPAFLHHPLVLRPDGAKLSKADGDTGVRDLRAAGWSRERVLAEAAAAGGLIAPGGTVGSRGRAGSGGLLGIDDLPDLFSAEAVGQR